MNILHLVPTGNWAGTEQQSFSFANFQSKNNNVTIVIVTNEKFNYDFYKSKVNKSINLIDVAHIKSTENIAEYIKTRAKIDFDIIHAHLSLACRISKLLKNNNNVCIGHMHIRYYDIHFSHMDAVIAISEWQLRDVPSTFPGKTKLIWNFTTKSFTAKNLSKISFVKNYYGLKDTDYIIGTMSRLHFEKGIDILIRAFDALNLENSKLIVIGGGPEETKLKNLTNNENIIFTGFLNNSSEYLNLFDVYISSARSEPFGLSILEALTYGLPVLSSRAMGPIDIFKENQDYLFDIDSVESLVYCLKNFIKSKPKQNLDLSRFDETNSNEQLLNFYRELLEDRKVN